MSGEDVDGAYVVLSSENHCSWNLEKNYQFFAPDPRSAEAPMV